MAVLGALLELAPELLTPEETARLTCAAQRYEHLGSPRLRELARQLVLTRAFGDLHGDEALRLMRRHGVALLTRIQGQRVPLWSLEVLQRKLTRASPIVVGSVEAECTAKITYTMHVSRGDVRIIFRVSGHSGGGKSLDVAYEAWLAPRRRQTLAPVFSLRLNVNVIIFGDRNAEFFEFIPEPGQSGVIFSTSPQEASGDATILFALQVTSVGAPPLTRGHENAVAASSPHRLDSSH
jgi:hypothetical protein